MDRAVTVASGSPTPAGIRVEESEGGQSGPVDVGPHAVSPVRSDQRAGIPQGGLQLALVGEGAAPDDDPKDPTCRTASIHRNLEVELCELEYQGVSNSLVPRARDEIGVHASSAEPAMLREDTPCTDEGTQGMTMQEATAFRKMKAFCSSIIQRLAPPLIREVQASQLRPDAEPFTPRRTTRVAKRSAQNQPKATPAENVLLQALGIAAEDLQVDDEMVRDLRELFDSPLREQHVRVFAAIFGKTLPSRADLEMANATVVLTR